MSCSSVMKLPECYRILHVSPGVKWEETKKSYRDLALKFHPDHHPDIEGSENQQSFLRTILQRRVEKELAVDIKNQLIDSIGLWEKKVFLLDVEKEIKIDSGTVANGGTGKMNTLKAAQGVIKFTLPRNTTDGQTFILKAKANTEEALRTNHIVKIRLT